MTLKTPGTLLGRLSRRLRFLLPVLLLAGTALLSKADGQTIVETGVLSPAAPTYVDPVQLFVTVTSNASVGPTGTITYTVDQGTDQVQETYLAAIGGGWLTQSLSANYHTPTTNQSPIVLLHPDAGGVLDWVSVFTVDEFTAHLQETYLSNVGFPGDSWVSQDLSSPGGTMPGEKL